jgi:hypothetical protein
LAEQKVSAWYFLSLAGGGLYGYLFMRSAVFDLADEVFDDGDALLVRFGKTKHRIALTEIVNVSYSPTMSPPRVVLALRETLKFGKQVAFSAPITLIPFTKSAVISELVEHINVSKKRSQ